MTIGVLTSGGDSPGMNACVRAVVRTALASGETVLAIRDGLAGLLAGELEPIDYVGVSNIIQRGGTVLGTSRSEEFKTSAGRQRAVAVLRAHGVDGLVLIGGDGTYRAGEALMRDGGPPCVGAPGTIDNDVYGTDRTIGFDTAVNTALVAIDRIRDTATSHELLHFIEVMGRHSGWIALAAGVAGGAEGVLLPETTSDLDALAERIEADLARGKRGALVVVSEGDETGGAERVAAAIGGRLQREFRVTILGHIQRGGAPTATDRILASRLGAAAVDALLDGDVGIAVGEVGGEVVRTPFHRTWTRRRDIDEGMLRLISLLS